MPCQSCGYAVPLFDFKKHRTGLNSYSTKLESEDIKAETDSCAISISTGPASNTAAIGTIVPTEIDAPSQVQSYPLTDKGLKGYWRDQNAKSIDGLTGVTNGFKSAHQFSPNAIKAVAKVQSKDVERVGPASLQIRRGALLGLFPGWKQEKQGIIVGFLLGALAMVVAQRAMSVLAGILTV